MPIYTFTCVCGKTFDRIVPMGTKKASCDCGKKAKRITVEVPAKRNPAHGIAVKPGESYGR